jgi:hypothetical protein
MKSEAFFRVEHRTPHFDNGEAADVVPISSGD